jgi:hypothetical protein
MNIHNNNNNIKNANVDQNNNKNINMNNVDDRISKICDNAEIQYEKNHRNNNNGINNNNQITENGIGSVNNSNYYINNKGDQYSNNPQSINNNNNKEKYSETYSNMAKINNKSLDTDINVISKIKLGLQNANKYSNASNNNYYNNIKSPFHKDITNYNEKLALYDLHTKNTNKSNKIKDSKISMDLSKILLESRDLIKKLKIKQAYILLKKTISTGTQHSDLFYLYGEVNRLIKQYKTAEDYLLKAVKFELHSPYVFYSLGILYQELKEYQNSNKFFKLFHKLMDSADLHFQMGINYFYMKDYANAAEEISQAIDLNNECAEYYLLRSEIYKKMGLKEMENEDFNMYWFIVQKRKEEQ